MAKPKSLLSPLPAGLSNLTVHLGQDAEKRPVKPFEVLAEVMCMHSSVWNAMLRPDDGRFLEAGAKEVSFPDDDPDAFEVVLAVVHGQFDGIPEKMAFSMLKHLLKHLLTIIDKYDLSKTMKTFTPKWTSNLSFKSDDITNYQDTFDFDGWLSVSWNLGLEEPFSLALTVVSSIT